MPMIDRTDDDLDPAAVLAEDDRIRAEAATERSLQRASELPGLIYRRQENARPDSASYAGGLPAFDEGGNSIGGIGSHVGKFDVLVEALGDALGLTRTDLRREWEASDAKLFDRIGDLQATNKNLERELKTLTANHENAQARIAELEHQLVALTETRIAILERQTKLLAKALPGKAARISAVENQVKALSEAIGGEPSARDLDSRIGYVEALMSTMFPIPSRSRA
jgi:hypothetical protein